MVFTRRCVDWHSCTPLSVMLLLAATAAPSPAQIAWLNDLSLMPPVSVTMHARNLPPPLAAGGEELDDVELLGELEDDPQAAASSVITPAIAAIRICALKMYLLCPGAPPREMGGRLDRWSPAGLGRDIRPDPPGLPEG